jgi:hypothetical protein
MHLLLAITKKQWCILYPTDGIITLMGKLGDSCPTQLSIQLKLTDGKPIVLPPSSIKQRDVNTRSARLDRSRWGTMHKLSNYVSTQAGRTKNYTRKQRKHSSKSVLYIHLICLSTPSIAQYNIKVQKLMNDELKRKRWWNISRYCHGFWICNRICWTRTTRNYR